MRWLVDARPVVDPSQGGVSRVARGLVTAFVADRPTDEFVLVTTGSRTPSASQLPQSASVTHIHLSIPNKLWSLLCFFHVTSLDRAVRHRAGSCDRVFLPNLGFVGTLKTPTTLLVHDLSFLIEPTWFNRKMRWWHHAIGAKKLIRRADQLLAVSETTKRDAMRLLDIPAERVVVIPVGAGSPCPERPNGGRVAYAPTNRYVLALGANDPRKNAATAIEAIRALRTENEFTDLKLFIVGAHAVRLPKEPWIRPILRPSDAELASLYEHAAAFLYPSWYEGFGLPLHEAAAFGTPCIASTAGALPETAPDGTVFADPTKPHHWAEALEEILSDPLRFRTRGQGRSWHEAAKIVTAS